MTCLDATVLLEWLCCGADESPATPRVLVVVAHPDDETVGAASLLPRLRTANFAYVTDGAPRDLHDARRNGFQSVAAYSAARAAECCAALGLTAIGPEQIEQLGFADQEASFRFVALTQRLAALVAQHAPEIVLTQPCEGGHPDHDATAFAVHAAVRLLARAGANAPVIAEMTAYHNGPGGITPGEFLNARPPIFERVLSAGERDLKRRMLACYRTQANTLQYFRTDVERFRLAPHYVFTQPPHAGALFYEQHPWGMTGARWRALAADTLQQLGLADGQ